MNIRISFILILSALLSFFSCSKEAENTRKDFSVSSDKCEIRVGKSDTLHIVSGNGDYRVVSLEKSMVRTFVKGDMIILEGMGTGQTKVLATDLVSEKIIEIQVNVLERFPELSLSASNFELENGNTGRVKILSGTGSYSLSDYDKKIIEAGIENGYIVIKALAEGRTDIMVGDVESKESKRLSVNVKKSIPPIKFEFPSIRVEEFTRKSIGISGGSGRGDMFLSLMDSVSRSATLKLEGDSLIIKALNIGRMDVVIWDKITDLRDTLLLEVIPSKVPLEFANSGLRYRIYDRERHLVSVLGVESGLSADVEIPEKVVWEYDNQEYRVAKISSGAFSGAEVERLVIPASVNEIELPVCHGSKIRKFVVKEGNERYKSSGKFLIDNKFKPFAGKPFNDYKTEKPTIIASANIGLDAAVVIPDEVRAIAPEAFLGRAGVRSVSFSYVTFVGVAAFMNMPDLKTIYVKEVEILSEKCFNGCYALRNVVVGEEIYPPQTDNLTFPMLEGNDFYNEARLVIPEWAVCKYSMTARFQEFKRVAAYSDGDMPESEAEIDSLEFSDFDTLCP